MPVGVNAKRRARAGLRKGRVGGYRNLHVVADPGSLDDDLVRMLF